MHSSSSPKHLLQNVISGIFPNAKHIVYILEIHCPKFKAEFWSKERSLDGMKLHREKYSGDFILYNLPELFQDSEKPNHSTARKPAPL
jgi:hypothetical protein